MKKALIVLGFVISLIFPLSAERVVPAEDDFSWAYSPEKGGVVIASYIGQEAEIALPAQIGGKPVVEIAAAAFAGSSVKTVEIPPSVQVIGAEAFSYSLLEEVFIPAAELSAAGKQFAFCENLRTVHFAQGFSRIPQDCFRACYSLQRIEFPASLTYIGASAFYETDLIEVAIPSANMRIQYGFSQVRRGESRITVSPKMSLENKILLRKTGYDIPVDENDFYWANKSDFDYSSEHDYAAWRGGYTYIYDVAEDGRSVAVQQYLGNEIDLEVPEQIEGRNVTEVSLCRLSERHIPIVRTVILPNTVRKLGKDCFANCKELISVFLPEGLEEIGDSAFYGDVGITSLSIPEGVKSIGNTAFSGTSLTELLIPLSVQRIGSSAFSGTRIRHLELPPSVPLTSPVFAGAKLLEEVVLPNGLRELPADCFGYCISLKRVNLPPSLERIGERAFERCQSLSSVEIPSGVVEIPSNCFKGCFSLRSVALPARLSRIASGAFAQCRSLYELHIPAGVRGVLCDEENPFADSALPKNTGASLSSVFIYSGV